MAETTFTDYHEHTILDTQRKVIEMHGILTNGLQEKVARIDKQVSILVDPEKRAETCPVVRYRRKRRKSWEWYMVVAMFALTVAEKIGIFEMVQKLMS